MGNLAKIIETTESLLSSRPSRSPDFEAENRALRRLASEMADHPDRVLRTLCEQVIEVCGAESAGVSLLKSIDHDADFYWPAIAGIWADFEGGGMPRNSSPCGLVLQHDGPLIFHDVEIQFPAAAAASPRIEEILLAPFRVDGRPIGTVWAIVHSNAKRFDGEDRRLLESVAQFAAAAYKMTNAEKAARDAEERLDLVNHELAHRLKNMLAMVIAVASQTLKHVTERDAVDAFQKRLLALGSAHDILVDQTWVAASLQTVAGKVLGLIVDASRVTVSGPHVILGPRSALTLSLILHELGTNAIKYGAFSRPDGRASFTWEVTQEKEPRLLATWLEENGPAVTAPTKKSFGTQLINMGLFGAGGVKLLYQADGLKAEFEAPLHLTREPS